MPRERKYRYFSCDFETTVYEGQTDTEAWASAIVEFGSEDVKICHSIDETFKYLKSLKCNMICYYHNLKFDGQFWMYYLLHDLGMQQAVYKVGDGKYDLKMKKKWAMPDNTFIYSISSKGMWYSLTMKVNHYYIELRDSMKLLPFSVRKLGKDFQTKHQKLEMEYKGFRYAGCNITPEEQKYIANDVLVVKEAMEMMFAEGHNKLTIGSCCMSEYKLTVGSRWDKWFPDMTKLPLNAERFGSSNADEYIRHSYKGGWCYVAKGKQNRIFHDGLVADVNSLYPSMMHSDSGNRYPVGNPTFWYGNYIPDEALEDNHYFFVRIKTRFYLKENMLPFIQIKGSWFYKGTEALESSDVLTKNGDKVAWYKDENGVVHDTRVVLTLTGTDYKLFREHYDVKQFEILDGCWFNTEIGIFDEYINKYREIKMNSKGAKRAQAKLFLNNLYGKFASSTDSSFKYAYLSDKGVVEYVDIPEQDKEAGFIPVGSAITSYARNFTIRAAQANYYGPDKRGFIYADTDSIHCDLEPDKVKGITVDDRKFCCWKLESSWDCAVFARQKTYIEHVTKENLEPVEPYWNVKCAGMPDNCKANYLEEHKGRELQDFHVGLEVQGKLMPKRIRGGVLLVEGPYKMR